MVGKPFPNDVVGSGNAHGKVIVLKRTGITWADAISTYALYASDKKDGDYFGSDVAISAGRILIGADEREIWDTSTDAEALVQKGRAYIFEFDGTSWNEEYIFAPDSAALYDRFHFGAYVALDGDTALVGNDAIAIGNCETPIPVYGFSRNLDGSWSKTVLMSYDLLGGNTCSFGQGVAVNGNSFIIHAYDSQLLFFENWQLKQWLYADGRWGYTDGNKNGNCLAMGTDVVFSGVDRGIDYTTAEGSVYVYDNFSVRPVSICLFSLAHMDIQIDIEVPPVAQVWFLIFNVVSSGRRNWFTLLAHGILVVLQFSLKSVMDASLMESFFKPIALTLFPMLACRNQRVTA